MGFLLETDHDSGIRARAPCEFGFGLIDLYIRKNQTCEPKSDESFSSYSIFGEWGVWIKFRENR
ncbi:hypothetical protein [Leptospira barantonii]|uniref:hypothetical protein n=1 Tax=Leptospira barantonii TaxID=2023184 RepID=UPI0031343F43